MTKLEEYSKKAREYDTRNVDKCYKWESQDLILRIKEFKKTNGNELLDVGCGTGGHLIYLQDKFDCTGIDLYKEMLGLAGKKLKKKVKLFQGDMTSFNLDKEFDVIICLYSVINFSKTYPTLRKTLRNFYRHLKKGGVVIIEPYYTVKVYKNFSGNTKRPGLLMTNIGKWSKIMRSVGFKVKYFYRGLHYSAKGLFILTK